MILALTSPKMSCMGYKQLQYPSLASGPIDSTIHDKIEHYNTQHFNDCSPKSLRLSNWNICMWKHGEYPLFLKYTRVGNEWGRKVLQAWSPIVVDRLIVIGKEYYRGQYIILWENFWDMRGIIVQACTVLSSELFRRRHKIRS